MTKFSPTEQMTMFSPSIAAYLGTNEAIIIQHIQSWTAYNKRNGKNFHDGFFWTFDSIDEMQRKYFPFMHKNTVTNVLKRLEERKIVVSGNYNISSFDRTKWYRVDEDALTKLDEEIEENNKKFDLPLHNECEMEESSIVETIPVSTTISTEKIVRPVSLPRETTRRTLEYSVEDGFENDCPTHPSDSDGHNVISDKSIQSFISWYIEIAYPVCKEKKHEELGTVGYQIACTKIKEYMQSYSVDLDDFRDIAFSYMSLHFSKNTDYNILHFLSENVFDIVYHAYMRGSGFYDKVRK